MTQKEAGLNITIFFCQRLDAKQDANRRMLEKELGSKVRFFPMPCTGRIDSLHLMRALESGADRVYVLACAEGKCRFREGNARARKRLAYAQTLIKEIGLEGERLEMINFPSGNNTTIDGLALGLLGSEATMGPSPLRQ